MIHPISRNQHILTDYLLGPVIVLAPILVGFRTDTTPTMLCFVIGALVFAATLMTRTELGLLRIVPFRMHLMGDVLGGALFLAAPWVFGFSTDMLARNTFLAFGALILGATALTKPVNMPDGEMPFLGGHQPNAVLSR